MADQNHPRATASGGFTPRATKAAQALLDKIGRPEKTPFKPDPFQAQAVAAVENRDVLVSAPTGSGKTWIAVQAMARVLKNGGQAWYASPLKALSNAKLLEFSQEFGPDRVGILTGDRKENPDAPIVVGTTEILRNQLYDDMYSGEDFQRDIVILDEAHYLGDEDRGTVWEEVLIYLPGRVRLLLLSATMANADELAAWLETVRGAACRVIFDHHRPVPLSALHLSANGEFEALFRGRQFNPRLEHGLERRGAPGRGVHLEKILKAAQQMDLLPAIFFLPSRADCDQALAYCSRSNLGAWQANLAPLNQEVDRFLGQYPFLKGHRLLGPLRRGALASHHAGHLPLFKLLVEKLMQQGLLRAVFATSTIAAGVNFPARSVVLPQSDRYNGRHFVPLTASELAQMTGRAGRRGMDRVGFIILPPGPHMNLRLVADLLNSPPEPIESRLSLNFSMVLNLLLSHTPAEVKPLLDLSLAAFQSAGRADSGRPAWYGELNERFAREGCGGLEQALTNSRAWQKTSLKLNKLKSGWNEFLDRLRLESLLSPGRIVIDDRGRPWLYRKKAWRKNRPGLVGTRLEPQLKLKRGRLRMKFLGLDRLDYITDRLVAEAPDKDLLPILRRLSQKKFKAVEDPEELSPAAQTELDQARAEMDGLETQVQASPCPACPLFEACHGAADPKLRGRLAKTGTWLAGLTREKKAIWAGFVNHLEFLKSEGFVDGQGRPSQTGTWASDLRLDHPLLIAQAINDGALPDSSPQLLAGLVAPFVLDRARAFSPAADRYKAPGKLSAAYLALEKSVQPLARRQHEAGFASPRLRFAPALAVYLWAGKKDWEELVGMFEIEPGDLSALILRTADNLRQLGSLGKAFPQLAACAKKARQIILREPVLVPD